jgi:hypothetical protein
MRSSRNSSSFFTLPILIADKMHNAISPSGSSI